MKILVVCTGNTCRSPMGEGILKYLSKKYNIAIEAKSAGIFALDGDRASDNAILALNNIGIDISNHISKQLHEGMIEEADIVLTMTDDQKNKINRRFSKSHKKVYSLNYYAFGMKKDIQDPYGRSLKNYELARDEIFKAIEKIVQDISKK